MTDMNVPVTTAVDTNVFEAQPENTGLDYDDSDPSSYWEIEEGKNTDGSKKTRKVSLAEARKLAQKGAGADKTFNEAKTAREEALQTKQQMAQLARLMQEDPWQIIEAFGLDADDLIKARFQRQFDDARLDPRDRRLRELESELEGHRTTKAEQEKADHEAAVTAKANEFQATLMTKIDGVLGALPKSMQNSTTVGEIGRYLTILNDKTDSYGNPIDIFSVSIESIAKHIMDRKRAEYQSSLESVDDDNALLDSIDPKTLKRIMNAQTKKLTDQGIVNKRNVPVGNVQSTAPQKPVRKTQVEIEREHRERINNLDAQWKKRNPGR